MQLRVGRRVGKLEGYREVIHWAPTSCKLIMDSNQ